MHMHEYMQCLSQAIKFSMQISEVATQIWTSWDSTVWVANETNPIHPVGNSLKKQKPLY